MPLKPYRFDFNGIFVLGVYGVNFKIHNKGAEWGDNKINGG